MPHKKTHKSIKDLQRRIAVYEDEAAYKELFFLLFPSLTRFAEGILQSKENAEEIVSDVFIAVWNDRAKLNKIDDLQLYIYVAVKNNAVRKAKQLNKNSTVSLEHIHVEMDSLYQTPEERMLSGETVGKIETAINNLPNKARLILKLAKEDRMKYKDIATLLNISVKTVDNQLAIALKKLASAISEPLRKKK
ncbi:RNA polymerase sigma-70 factor (ECF subfamily) [Lacibacter cauensis]|uniref:RNA polymerase sigma-70 factor (ECF subfamily) n=1 Tax=Lacibacter cauensis TaxID=510947 RepID=A0A562SH54_9BACT|nr:RNA polymerase sigma-70 factor [Lacibacter cauensis]TWI80304.1 RNA polymerase sigma-70 factor (ECF subfamily) [Lacibacter cauensis]